MTELHKIIYLFEADELKFQDTEVQNIFFTSENFSDLQYYVCSLYAMIEITYEVLEYAEYSQW